MSISAKVQNDGVSKRDECSEFEDNGYPYMIKVMHYAFSSFYIIIIFIGLMNNDYGSI